MSKTTIDRAVVEQALEAFDVATTPLARDRQEVLRAQAALRAALEQPQVEQEPVTAQHRFRHPQKTMPDWSVWQPCKVAKRPAWEIDSQGYEVEYMPLYTHPQPPRQPLTEDGITQAFLAAGLFEAGDELVGYEVDIARAIERAHGIGGEA